MKMDTLTKINAGERCRLWLKFTDSQTVAMEGVWMGQDTSPYTKGGT